MHFHNSVAILQGTCLKAEQKLGGIRPCSLGKQYKQQTIIQVEDNKSFYENKPLVVSFKKVNKDLGVSAFSL